MELGTPSEASFYGMRRQALEAWLGARRIAPSHAAHLFRKAYKGLAETPWDDAPGLFPKDLAPACRAGLAMGPLPTPVKALRSGYDGSVKFLLALAGGDQVEAVLMPEKQRVTLCLSSQVGCRQGCVFCHTGRMGLKRNLTAGEIVGQVVVADRYLAAHPEWLEANRLPREQRVTNVVFMGMGEPLDNVDAVADALHILTDPLGLGLGIRRISVSTSGHLEGLRELARRVPGVRVALSVHSTDESKRSRIMPINRRWPLRQVMDELRALFGPDQRPVMLQYTMIAGVNDGLDEAHELVRLTRGLNAKVNLIPLNEVSASRLTAPPADRIQAFRDVLHAAGLRVMVRYSKGQDIGAACGQLIVASESTLKPA